ncbi:MAG TPA: hypothetical protein IAA02_04315 [Candidatus Sutterella merdavium]|nr:hypothetical protein [Candidatus Sutterella merdavium]
MAQFSPQLVQVRRMRPVATQHASSGITLASFRLNADGGASGEMRLLPISAAFVAEVFRDICSANFSEQDRRFVNRLARHRDARLRAAAAGVEDTLDSDTVRNLAKDPSFAVRQAIATNDDALGKLSGAECVELAATDAFLVADVINTLKRNVRRLSERPAPLPIGRESPQDEAASRQDASVALEKLRCVMDFYRNHPDYLLRNAVLDAEETLKELGKVSEDRTAGAGSECRNSRGKLARWYGFVGNPGEFSLGLVFLDEEAFPAGIVEADADTPLFTVPVEKFSTVVRNLPKDESSAIFFERLAANGCARVREAVADVGVLSQSAVEMLKNDPDYVVRLVLLRNEGALTKLSAQDIIGLFRGDAGLLRIAYEYGKPDVRTLQILRERFQAADDPGAMEFLESLGK